eukprot:Hpha_TRINITY_DN16778_c4_g1::TRINITY_DN16778_c4_g1_i1::g.77544::m.77544
MGCGTSSPQKASEPAPQTQTAAKPEPEPKPAKAPASQGGEARAGPAAPPGTEPDGQKTQAGQTGVSTRPEVQPIAPQPPAQPVPTTVDSEARLASFPAPQLIEIPSGPERFTICCFYDDSKEANGVLRFATRADGKEGEKFQVDAETPLFTKVFTDEELTAARDALPKGPEGAPLEWKSFWKMLNTSFQTGRLNVTGGGSGLDIKLKQSKEPKEMTWNIPLQKETSSAALVYEHFIQPFPRVCEHRRKQLADDAKEGTAKDKKELREQDFAKAEAEGSARLHPWTVSESIVLAADSAERRLADVLPELGEDAKRKRRMVGKQQNQMVKMNQQIEILRCGAASHPLDNLYACKDPKATAGQASLDASVLGWDTDTDDLSFVEVAVCLFHHHGLIEYFNMDQDALASYFAAVQEHCNDNPYHNAKRATMMMCLMNHVLGSADSPSSLISRVRMSKEDIFAALLSAGIVDLNHEGVTNAFVKRAGTMLSMLYSDLYQTDQDSLTVAFELMYNSHINILKSLSPEQVKDVTETVREALFIKANVQMADHSARFEEFRQLVASAPDWAVKDNVRHAITHALRMCDLAAWGRPLELHKKWMDRVREEFYLQGDKETKLGLPPSTFQDTQWTTARERDDSDFAAGQVHFIDSVVLPLYLEMQRLVPELESCAKEAKENRAHWEQAGGLKAGHFKKALQSFGKVFTATKGEAGGMVAFARPGPDVVRTGLCMWISAVGSDGISYVMQFDEAGLSKHGLSLKGIADAFHKGGVKSEVIRRESGEEYCSLTVGEATLTLDQRSVNETQSIYASLKSTFELRRMERQKDIERQLDKLEQQAKANRDKALLLEGEARALRSCIDACNKQIEEDKSKLEDIEQQLQQEAGDRPIEKMKMEREDALSIKVRNPLKAPLPPGVTKPPDCKDVDLDLLKLLKSRFFTKEGGAKTNLEAPLDAAECNYVNVVQPMLTSEFSEMTKNIPDPTRNRIYDLLKKLDDWDYDVFELQTAMSGGISGECMREQPHGGALFVTMYALVYKWQFMQKFNLNEQVLLNWLSIVEAGY